MEGDIKVRKVTQDVLRFVWFKHGALSEEPPKELNLIPEISAELMNNLSTLLWIESFRSYFMWEDFFMKHFDRMISSPKLFANYVSYAFYLLNESADAYKCFFDILSLVSDVSLRCLERKCKAYVHTCVDLFCAFFDKELYKKFEEQGSWKNLNAHLQKEYNSMQFKYMVRGDESPIKLNKRFQDEHEKVNRQHYIINGIVLESITRTDVESHERAASFAESIQGKMEKLFQQTFDKIIVDFDATYYQVKELCQRTDDKAALEVAIKTDHSSSKREKWQRVEQKKNRWNGERHVYLQKDTPISRGMGKGIQQTSSQKDSNFFDNTAKEKKLYSFQKEPESPENIPNDAKLKELERKTDTASGLLEIQDLNRTNIQDTVPSLQALHFTPKKEMVKNLLNTMSAAIAKLFQLIQCICEEHGVRVPVLLGTHREVKNY